jgi:predicted nucleotidyltransferase
MSQTPSNISIDSILELILSDQFVETASHIPQETLEFASSEANREFIVQSILTSLQSRELGTATRERAEEVTDKLMQYAKIQVGK